MTNQSIVPTPVPQAPLRRSNEVLVRLVPRGGARSASQIFKQMMYLSRSGDIPLQRSERHLALPLPVAQLKAAAESWVTEAGFCQHRLNVEPCSQALTTHLIVSFPNGTGVEVAFAIGRHWAEEMFGSGRNGGTFDYVTACHDDRPHPHVHLIVHRRALEGHWLKISRRHAGLNYERLRETLAQIATQHGIVMEATSRVARGIAAPPITYAEYRRRARRGEVKA